MAHPLAEARELAGSVVEMLEPHVERVVVAGSIRRCRSRVGDIEIVAEVPFSMTGLFGDMVEAQVEPVKLVLAEIGRLEKAGDRYVKVVREEGPSIDVFLVHPPAEWGTILAIRTGPADLSAWAVTRARKLGKRVVDGHVETVDGTVVPTPDEEAFFRACGLNCLPPVDRSTSRAKWPRSED